MELLVLVEVDDEDDDGPATWSFPFILGPTALDPDPSEGKGTARRFLLEGIKGEEEEERIVDP